MEEVEPSEDFAREFAEAEERGRGDAGPRAVGARYLPGRRVLIVALAGGAELHVPIDTVEGLADASPADLRAVEITPAGTGLYFPRIDADVHVPSLVAGVTGSRRWTAQRRRIGEAARPDPGEVPARAGGHRGGRPSKAGG